MPAKLKLLRWTFGATLFLLAFLGIFSLPKDWQSATALLATIESWWAAKVAHPSLTALIVGLLFSSITA